MEPKHIYFWSAVIWSLLIAVMCLTSFSHLPTVKIPNTDKYVHFTFHFVFTGLWILYLISKTQKQTFGKIYGSVFLISLLYGSGIEIAQDLFTVTRKADILDVCANASGSAMFIIAIVVYKNYFQKNKMK